MAKSKLGTLGIGLLSMAMSMASMQAWGAPPQDSGSASVKRTPAGQSLLNPRTDDRGAVLNVELDWSAQGQSHGVLPKIIVRPDNLIVTTSRIGAQAQDVETGCANRLKAQHVPGQPLSVQEMQQILDCQSQMTLTDARSHLSNRRSVFLPMGAGPRKCSELGLANGSYRICAALLQQTADSFQMEYEEDSKVNGTVLVTRARFEVTLQRYPATSLLAGRITGCTVKMIAAYTFDQNQPGRMTPSERARLEHCSRNAV